MQKRSKTCIGSEASPSSESDVDAGQKVTRGTKVRRLEINAPISLTPTRLPKPRYLIRRIEGFILQDPLTLAPTSNELCDLVDSILALTSTTAATLLDSTDTKYNQRPEMSRFVHSISLTELCKLVYGVDDVTAFVEEDFDAQVEIHAKMWRKANQVFVRQDLQPEMYSSIYMYQLFTGLTLTMRAWDDVFSILYGEV